MSAYILGFVKSDGSDSVGEYIRRLPALHEKYGAELICYDNKPTALEEQDDSDVVVLLKFADRESARSYWNSPEYQAARKFRLGHRTVKAVLIESQGQLGG